MIELITYALSTSTVPAILIVSVASSFDLIVGKRLRWLWYLSLYNPDIALISVSIKASLVFRFSCFVLFGYQIRVPYPFKAIVLIMTIFSTKSIVLRFVVTYTILFFVRYSSLDGYNRCWCLFGQVCRFGKLLPPPPVFSSKRLRFLLELI